MGMHRFQMFQITMLRCPSIITMLESHPIQLLSGTRIVGLACIVLTVSARVTTVATANAVRMVQSPARALMLRRQSGIAIPPTNLPRLLHNTHQITRPRILTRTGRTQMAMPRMQCRPMITAITPPITRTTHHIRCVKNTNTLPLTLLGTRTNPPINRMLTHLYPGILIRAHTPRPHNSPGCSSRAPCQLLHLLYRPCFSTLLTKQIFVSVFFPCASPWPFVETLARNMNCSHVMIKNLNPIIEIDRALVSRTL